MFPLSKKITLFAFCLVIYLTGVGLFALFTGNQEKETIIADIDQRLLLAAKGLKYMLAPDFHDRALAPDSIPIKEVLQNQRIISSYAADSGFTYLYTVIEHDKSFFFAAPTVTEEEYKERQNWYFYPYSDIPAKFIEAFETISPVYVTYHDQWGIFRSVALPQKTPGGRIYLSCADMDISFMNKLVKDVYLGMILYSGYFLLLTLPFSLTYFHYNRRLTLTNKKLAEQQEQLEALVAKRTRDLEKEKCRAEESDRLKSIFMANVSHEIRTPLNSILGFSELINKNCSLEEAVKNASFITRSGEHLFKLVDQLLDHNRITSGQVEMMIRPFDIIDFINTLIQSEMVTAQKKGLGLFFNIDEALPKWMDGDQFRLRQVLLNLINNAVKFTPKGRIDLDVKCTRMEQEAVWVSFSVKDTGIGIPQDKLESIFSPFVQADNGTARIFGGTGLGTTIARQLVTSMGGKIHAQNNENMGCCFWFVIPLKKSQITLEKDKFSEMPLKECFNVQRPGSILVVDDYPSNLVLSRCQLESGGHNVVTVDSGIQAMKCCEKQFFDLILMDINMAGMDGYKTTQLLIKGNGWTRQVPIIAMTASADIQTKERCRKAGMVDLITKPVKRFQLLEMVEKWLQKLPQPDPGHGIISDPICLEQALGEFDGDHDLLDNVVRQFVLNLEVQINTITTAMDNNEFEQIRFQAHAIKGGAGNLTAYSLAKAAEKLEKAGVEKNKLECKKAFECLYKEGRRLKNYLDQGEGYIENSDC